MFTILYLDYCLKLDSQETCHHDDHFQLLRRHEPEAFIQMLAKLHDLDVLSVESAVTFLQVCQSTVSYTTNYV